ncbi:TetR/AcrR family transcriptional regulator [Microtetraspora malaysiensis]|uniref:TetR/AcrR family transcriptional regulator n=1 Tax=Microtetraspora malaysiensis TaxID=161358 RepID=UPI003D8E0F21
MARDQRRRDIVEALLRVAGERGLHAVTMRAVAAEAGVSLHLVQHYFETKEQLLLSALQHLAERMAERVKTRLGQADRGPRATVEAILAEALPTDEQSRVFHLVYTSYMVLAVTDPALAAHPLLAAPNVMEDFITDRLRDMGAGPDARLEAVGLLAMSAGLGAAVLSGQRSADDAMTAMRHQLDRLEVR